MEKMQFKELILFEDNHLLVVNKPNNILVQGDKTGDLTILDFGKSYLKEKYQKPGNVFLGLVHRLDRPVSGVLIMARTSKALSRLNKQLREKSFEKSYLAILDKKIDPSSGIVESYLLKDTKRNIVSSTTQEKKGSKKSTTKYKTIKQSAKYYLLSVNPITGRSHQIRVHLSTRNCPIAGDLKYGSPYALPNKSIALHCRKMSILHPVLKEPIVFKAPTPQTEIWRQFNVEKP